MKIFILEDDENRIAFFRQKFAAHVLYISKNVEDGKINAQEYAPFDVMFLDHDLAPEHYKDFDPSIQEGEYPERTPDGHDFVKWLVNNKQVIHEYTQIIIHSLNPTGSQNMERTINESALDCMPKRIPFTTLCRII